MPQRKLLTGALLALAAGMGCAGPDGPVPVRLENVWDGKSLYICRRAKGKIDVDDKIHADQWAHAMVINRFHVPIAKTPAREQTEMRMLWDDKCIYVHFVAYDADLFGTYTGKTDPIWSEDAVEVFFQPDLSKPSYYEFEVNPINALLALQIPSQRWGTLAQRADWKYSIRRATRSAGTVNHPADRDKYFHVVLAIPFYDLRFAGRRPPQAGEKWRFIGARCNNSTNRRGGKELSACVPLPTIDFHLGPHYPTMIFAE